MCPLDGLVVLLVAGGPGSVGVATALERAGACVRVTPDLAAAWRANVLLGYRATVVVEPGTITAPVHTGLRALSRQGAVLLLRADATSQERIRLLDGGADCVLTSSDPGEVVAALGAVLRRSRMPATRYVEHVIRAGAIRVHLLHRTATAAGLPLVLTPLEFDLLAYFAAHAGEALSRDRLLNDVWGYDIGGRETVTVHVRRLRAKIESRPSHPVLLQTIWGVGYRLNPYPATASTHHRPPRQGSPTQGAAAPDDHARPPVLPAGVRIP